eukprot:6128479-Amphidinium_carterae.1
MSKPMTMRCGILLRLTWKRGENRFELAHGKVFLACLNSFRIDHLTWCHHVKNVHRVSCLVRLAAVFEQVGTCSAGEVPQRRSGVTQSAGGFGVPEHLSVCTTDLRLPGQTCNIVQRVWCLTTLQRLLSRLKSDEEDLEQAELDVRGETLHTHHGTRSTSFAVKGMGRTYLITFLIVMLPSIPTTMIHDQDEP